MEFQDSRILGFQEFLTFLSEFKSFSIPTPRILIIPRGIHEFVHPKSRFLCTG